MSAETLVEVAAFGLAVWAGLLSLPRPPQLEWERLFKVMLSVLTAGQVEAELGRADAVARDAWMSRVLGVVLWNPVGRQAEDKLRRASLDDVAVPALDGERALVQALSALPDPVARLQRLYVEDAHAKAELFGDPQDLGPAHNPAHSLGPDADWDHVAGWTEQLQELLARRLADVVFVLDGLDDDLSAQLSTACPALRVIRLAPFRGASSGADGLEVDVDGLFASVEAALTADSDRVVMLAAGPAVQQTLAALVEGGGLRDRCLAVVSLAGQLQTPDFAPWLDQHFDNVHLDTELKRSVPYFCVVDVDPARPLAEPWDRQRFPQPPVLPSGRAPVEVVDLGALHLAALHPRELARALLLLLAVRITA